MPELFRPVIDNSGVPVKINGEAVYRDVNQTGVFVRRGTGMVRLEDALLPPSRMSAPITQTVSARVLRPSRVPAVALAAPAQ